MNYFDLYSSYPDRTIAAAWDSQVREADKTPWLAGTLTECGDELFARFAACYAELRALPRGARRALQRRLARSVELAAILPEYLQGGRGLQLDWPGPWPEPLYCWHWGKESRTQPQSPSRPTILTSYRMASVR